MNLKIKNILLGAGSLIGISTIALTASCQKTGKGDIDIVDEVPPYMTNKTMGKVTLLGRTSTEYQRAMNSTGNSAKNPAQNGFKQKVRDSIVIAHTFGENGSQGKALATLAETYNAQIKIMKEELKKYVEAHPDDKDAIKFTPSNQISIYAKPVTLKNIGSGYSAGAQKVNLDLTTRNASQFYDLVFNYAPVASSLGNNGMLLSFNSKDSAKLNTDLTDFSEQFTVINAETQYIDNMSSWILPAFKSTNVVAINAPVLNYIYQTILTNGGVIKAGDTVMEAQVKELQEKGKNDNQSVAALWGKTVSNIAEILKPNGKAYELSSSIWNNYKELIEFAKLAQSLFENTSQNGAQSDLHVFGVDSATSLYEQALYADLGADSSKMIQAVEINPGNKSVQISYRPLENTQSDAYSKSRQIYDVLTQAVQNGGVKLFPGGQFSSGDQTKHRFAFSIGSTAGYTHNFVAEKEKITIDFVNSKTGRIINGLGFETSYSVTFNNVSGNKSGVVTLKAATDGTESTPTGKLENFNDIKPLYTFGAKSNGLFAAEITKAVNKENQNFELPQYAIMFDTKQDQTKFMEGLKSKKIDLSKAVMIGFPAFSNASTANQKAFTDALDKMGAVYANTTTTGAKSPTLNVVFPNALVQTKAAQPAVPEQPAQDGKPAVKGKSAKPAEFGFSDAFYDLLAQNGFVKKVLAKTDFLEKEELVSLPTPGKWVSTDAKNVIFAQGPSIIGIKSNPTDETATKAFVKWLITSTKTYDTLGINKDFKNKQDKGTPATPRDFVQSNMSYIMPYKDFQNATSLDFMGTGNKTNDYLRVAFNLFKNAANNPDQYAIFEEPGSLIADSFRAGIDGAWDGLQKTISNGEKAQDFTSFINKITSNIQTNKN
ncbi:P68 family surface lipoprotein [Mycoplasma seminis]|uniref:P80 family lipoprotein n=1 Tax=Mycoplasma seminis TaxID=512749 RepID=A0ABY9HBK2_9MOLU|nr:P80 family lipoprotein [Mycoplasma seminis]WLP85821.1 P80 family lipoprotein [Mycoplasma seminis]